MTIKMLFVIQYNNIIWKKIAISGIMNNKKFVEVSMLKLKNIVKVYVAGDNNVEALKGVSINFRKNEFVSILGQSGCGKTTLLNIIGGLDQYSEGDLLINGVSTKDFKDRDWDSYRNHSVGFVFQSYNLIPHQTVLGNVELALTLSGVSKHERRERAKAALIKVGLGDQIYKNPNQLSGGQMQRVAIARAIVNNPDIILADEPTGALDTETSVQVMEILKEIAEDRLVIMVTHNPDLAEEYSTRIIRMLDGKILSDSMPVTKEELEKQEEKNKVKREKSKKEKKPTMSFWTAFRLSLKNLFTKKGRTILTSFAGSIGIIGISLILAVSEGMTTYIDEVQESTLSSYPLTLESTTVDLSSLMATMMNAGNKEIDHDKEAIYKDPLIYELVNALANVEANENDLKAFKKYLEAELEKEGSNLQIAISGIQYTYNMNFAIYTENVDGDIIKSDLNELMKDMIADFMMKASTNSSSSNEDNSSSTTQSNPMFSMMMSSNSLWKELLPGLKDDEVINNVILEQYELVNGTCPNEYDEVVLIINDKNELDDLTLFALGLLSQEEIDAIIDAAASGATLETASKSWNYEELTGRTYKTILPYDFYQDFDGDGIFTDMSKIEGIVESLYKEALELKISGIIRPKEGSDASMLSTGIGYTSKLTSEIIRLAKESEVVKAQLENTSVNVLTGKPFKTNTGLLTNEEKKEVFLDYVDGFNNTKKAEIFVAIKSLLTEDELASKTVAEIANYPTRESQELLISNAMSEQLSVAPEMLQEYFKEMTDEQVYGYTYIVCQGIAQMKHVAQVKMTYSMQSTETLVALLEEELANSKLSDFARYYDGVTDFSDLTYDEVLVQLGFLDEDSPFTINIYSSTFENKDLITDAIEQYNNSVGEGQKISYTDYMGLLMSGITTIINAITYVLIAFVAISLVVSSIMIGVITLISVQERTKEIGILRAIGASKKDVSSMFNAETLIIGFASGLLGVVVTYLLCIPINLILHTLTKVENLNAFLPVPAAIILVLISMGLTLISGIIPSRSAAKKDPVIALRSE